MDEKSYKEYHSDNTIFKSPNKLSSNMEENLFDVGNLSKNSNVKRCFKLQSHEKSKKCEKSNTYDDSLESSNGHSQSSNENNEKYPHNSDKRDDENSKKSLSNMSQKDKYHQYIELSDSNNDNEQSLCSSECNKEKQYESDDSGDQNDYLKDIEGEYPVQRIKHTKSKRYELQASHSNNSDDNNKHKQLSNESDDECHHKSDDSDDDNESLGGTDDAHSTKKEKHTKFKRYELRSPHSDRKDKGNKYAVTSDSDADNKQRQPSNENDECDDNNGSISGTDDKNSNIREKHKTSKRYELRASHSDRKDKGNKYAVTSDSDDDIKQRQPSNESDDSDDNNESLSGTDDTNSNIREKHKTSKRYELRASHSDGKDKGNKYAVTSDSDDDIKQRQPSNESDDSDDNDESLSGTDGTNSNIREKHKTAKRYEQLASHSDRKDKGNKYAVTSDSDDDNKQRQQSNKSDDSDDYIESLSGTDHTNSNIKEKHTKFKRYELRASHSYRKDKGDKYAVTLDFDDENKKRQPSNESDDEYHHKSYNSDDNNQSLSVTDGTNTNIREKHKTSKRYELRPSHSDKKDKFNNYTVILDSDDDSDHKQFSNVSDNSDDKPYSINSTDNTNSATRENHKISNLYKLPVSYSDKKNADPTKTDQDNEHKLSSNDYKEEEHRKFYDSDNKSINSDNKSIKDTDEMEKLKIYKRCELPNLHLDKKLKSIKQVDLSDSDNENSQSTNKSDEEFQHKSNTSDDKNDSLNVGDNENLNNKEIYEKSKRYEIRRQHTQNKYKSLHYTDTSDNDDYNTWSQAYNESVNSDDKNSNIDDKDNRDSENDTELVTPYTEIIQRRNANISLDERINMLKSYYRSKYSYHKLASMFNCSRQQIKDTVANCKNIIKEYKKQYPDFDENELRTPKNRVCNTLSLKERIDVLRVYNRNHYNYNKLATMFNCSKRQIEYTFANRMTFINEYKNQHPDFDENVFKTNKYPVSNTLSWDERIDVIKASYRKNYSNNKLATMFNCSTGQIQNILMNRKIIIKEYKKQHPDFVEIDLKAPNKPIHNTLSLDERIEVLRENDRNHYPYYKLASMFNCSMGHIESTLANRRALIEEYKKQHPDFEENDLKTPKYLDRNTLSFDECIDVIKAYYRHHYAYYKLASMFNCSIGQIKHTLSNRKIIIEEYKRIHPDFTEKDLKTKTSPTGNTLSLDERIDILRANNRYNYPYYKLVSMFNCSMGEIKHTLDNRQKLIEEYKIQHPNFDENEFKTNEKPVRNTLSLEERIEVLRTHHHYRYPYYKLASMFNCLMIEIKNTLDNRKKFIKNYKIQHPDFDENEFRVENTQVSKTLTLNERIDVLRAHDRYHYPYYKLASMFNCSLGQIENTVANRKTLIEEYKKYYPDYDENQMESPDDEDNKNKSKNGNKLTLERCKEVIASYDQDSDYTKLSRLFNFSVAQIKSIIQNRYGIMERYGTSKNNISDKDNQNDIQNASTCLNSINEFSSNVKTNVHNISQTVNRNMNNNDRNIRNNSIDSTAKDAVLKIGIENKEFPTQNEGTYDVNDKVNDSYKLNDINQELTNRNNDTKHVKISNKMCQHNMDKSNSKLSDNDQSDKDDDGDYDSIKLSNEKTLRWNRLYLRKYLQVIKAYDQTNSYSVLASRFNCSWLLIYNVIEKRRAIIKALGNPIQIKLTFTQCIDVIRDYKLKNYTYQKLTQVYNCSLAEIKKCIIDRSSYMDTYNKLYPAIEKSTQKSISKVQQSQNSIMSLKKQEEIIKSFDQYPNEMLLSRLYNCSILQIFEIIENRGEILKKCQNNSQTNIFESLSISRHGDILLALKPLEAYAKLIGNYTAINIMSQLEEHLPSFKTNLRKSNYETQTNIEICSYRDALKALKPIEDYTNSTTNYKAKNAMSQLEIHLTQNL